MMLKKTPAQAAGITDRQRTVEDLVAELEAGPRGPYKKRGSNA